MTTLNCAICSRSFDVRNYRANTAKYCSRECWKQRSPPRCLKCPVCHNDFETYHKEQVFCSQSCARRGTPSNAYKDGRSMERDRARLSADLRDWRTAVYKRDGYICQQCGNKGKLHAHHIKEWAQYPELRFDISNGATLCEDCHGLIHGKNFANRRNKTCSDCGCVTKGRGLRCSSCAITHWHSQRVQV